MKILSDAVVLRGFCWMIRRASKNVLAGISSSRGSVLITIAL